ncbi:MAG: TolC family protein [Verrucomicrobia bacterium]|nr:TolC family protein [Verrucomicrobiota bacterium]
MGRFFLCFLIGTTSLFSLTVEEVEKMALENNPDIQSAIALVEKAHQSRLSVIGKWLPQLSLLSQAFRTQKPLEFFQFKKPSAFFTQLSLTQTVISSPLLHDIKVSSFIIDQFKQLVEAAKNDILYKVRLQYYLVALDRQKVATAEEHIKLLEYLAEEMASRHQIGEATPYNVNQARVAVANVQERFYRVFEQLKADRDELARLMGIDPSQNPYDFAQTDIDLTKIPNLNFEIEQLPMEEFTKWQEIADRCRPDILLSKTLLNVAEEKVRTHEGEYWPKLSILGGYGGGSTPYLEVPSERFNNQVFQWAVGLSLNWNLFDGLSRERNIRAAKAEVSSVRQDAKKTLQAAHTDVRHQLYKIEKSLAKYRTASANLELAVETMGQARSQLEIGYSTLSDYLISVDGWVQAKTNYDEGKFELLASYFGLLHASGEMTP